MKDRRKSTGANITDAKKSRIADAMGDDAKPSMREKKIRETCAKTRDAKAIQGRAEKEK